MRNDKLVAQSTVEHVDRWTAHTPERLSMPVLAALCDIFDCTPTDLIATKAENVAPRKTAAAGANVVDLADTIRPKRARIRR